MMQHWQANHACEAEKPAEAYQSSFIVWAWNVGFYCMSRVLSGAACQSFVALGICSCSTCMDASKLINCLPKLQPFRAGHVVTSASDACIKPPRVILQHAHVECSRYQCKAYSLYNALARHHIRPWKVVAFCVNYRQACVQVRGRKCKTKTTHTDAQTTDPKECSLEFLLHSDRGLSDALRMIV